MSKKKRNVLIPGLMFFGVAAASLGLFGLAPAEEKPSSYAPVDIKENFAGTMARMKADKAQIMQRQKTLLKNAMTYPTAPPKA